MSGPGNQRRYRPHVVRLARRQPAPTYETDLIAEVLILLARNGIRARVRVKGASPASGL